MTAQGGVTEAEAGQLWAEINGDPEWVAARDKVLAEAAEDGHTVTVARLAEAYRGTSEFRLNRAKEIMYRLGNCAIRLAAIDRKAVTSTLEVLAEDLGLGAPPVMMMAGESPSAWLREEAEGWAELAAEREILVVLVAGLDRLRRADTFSPRLTQRALAELWQRMTPDARRAFLARVDPRGELRGRA